MGGTAVLVVEIIRMFPHIHCQQRLETFGDRVIGVRFLRDNEFAILVGREPHPTCSSSAWKASKEPKSRLMASNRGDGISVTGDG